MTEQNAEGRLIAEQAANSEQFTYVRTHPQNACGKIVDADGNEVATLYGYTDDAEKSADGEWGPQPIRDRHGALLAAAPDLLRALEEIRLWLSVEGCDDQVKIADAALIAAGKTDVACPRCEGAGEWDEGPLSGSSGQLEPEYRQVRCPDCGGKGRSALLTKSGGTQ